MFFDYVDPVNKFKQFFVFLSLFVLRFERVGNVFSGKFSLDFSE